MRGRCPALVMLAPLVASQGPPELRACTGHPPSSPSLQPAPGTCDPVLRPEAQVRNHRPEADTGPSSPGNLRMRNGQEAEAGRALVRLQHLPVDQGRAARLEPGVLGSGLDRTPEPRIRAHVGASGRCRCSPCPSSSRTSQSRHRASVLVTRGRTPGPLLLPGGCFLLHRVLSLLPPLTTAGSNQSRFPSQGGAEQNRILIFSLSPMCLGVSEPTCMPSGPWPGLC